MYTGCEEVVINKRYCLCVLSGSEGEAPHKVTWSDYMEAALSKAAPDCCFKHVSTLNPLNCVILITLSLPESIMATCVV